MVHPAHRRPPVGPVGAAFRAWFMLVLVLVFPHAVKAEYFGKNKVTYERFHFNRLRTGRFDLYYYPNEEAAVKNASFMLERWDSRYVGVFRHRISRHQPVIIYANHADFQQTNVTPEIIGQGTGGFTEGMKNRIVLPLTGVASEDNHVLGHELVHVFQYEIAESLGGPEFLEQSPLWLVEGMAEYLSLGPDDPLTAMWLRDAALNNDIPSIHDMSTNAKYFPYRFGQGLWTYLTRRWGDRVIRDLFVAEVSRGWDEACRKVLKTDPDSVSAGWRAAVADTYGARARSLTPPDSVGRPLVVGDLQMNMAPVVSPDGRYVAFLSRRNVFTIDLYLADAQTGKVIERLASSNSDAHFDALRFSESSGAWSPDGARLAFVVYKNGGNRIALLDVGRRRLIREIEVKGTDAIQTLAWSPDGRDLAVGATHGGFADLYLYDLASGETVQLTEGPYAELQPAWSPDGNVLAFSTDRGAGTDFDVFAFGPIKIGLMNLETGATTLVAMPNATKHIDPQFSPDAASLYFIADPDGVSDIYRYSFADSSFYRVTSVATGVSGLGNLSPALSVAGRTGDLVFSVFEKGDYNIYALSSGPSGTLVTGQDEAADSALVLAVEEADSGRVERYLEDPRAGLPSELPDTISTYRPSLRLLALEPASVGVSLTRSGTSLAGGSSLLFGDLLGDHLLGVSVMAGGSVDYLGGEIIYENLKQRTDWGAAISHVPVASARIVDGVDTVDVNGQPTEADYVDLVRERVYLDTAIGLAEYPLSTNRRVEASAGYTRLTFRRDRDRIMLINGVWVDQGVKDLPSPRALNIFYTSLAYVGDYSFFGIGSPARGRRYRFDAEPAFGSLTYLTLLADYRRYFFLRPVTFAVRGYFTGRYLQDAEDSRLSPYFLGDESLVRGYSLDSFSLSECHESSSGRCPELDRLIGSKIGVFNAEVRVPVFGPEGYGLVNFTFIPTEVALFFDAGVAWTEDQAPVFKIRTESTQRIPVFSTGAVTRFNLFGSIVLQVYYVYPFQRPDKGGHFRFAIGAGW